MHIDISTDDRLSKLSLKLAYLSIFCFVIAIFLSILFTKLDYLVPGLGICALILSVFGIIMSNMARQNDEEHITRCLKAKVLNIVLCIIYVITYVFL